MPLNLQHYFKDTLQPMLHNEIEQSILTAQKLALESLRKDGLVVETEIQEVTQIGGGYSDKPESFKVFKLEVTIKFTIEV